MPEFRKCWESKFHRNISKEVYVNASNKPADVAEAFASHFRSLYTNSDDATVFGHPSLSTVSLNVFA